MSLQDIVNVQITKETSPVTRTGYGVPLILVYHTKDAARALEFTDSEDMLTTKGGPFASSDMAYILAKKAFSQENKPDKVIIGRRVNPTIRTVIYKPRSGAYNGETLPLANTAYAVTLTLDGVSATFSVDSGATPTISAILTALAAAINAGALDVKATATATEMTIERADGPGGTATAGTPFLIVYNRALATLEDTTPAAVGGSLASEIAAVQGVNDDWYGITGDWFGATEISAVAADIETKFKLHVAACQDDELYDAAVTDDLGSTLQSAGYARTVLFHHPKAELGIAPALLGRCLPKDPGSITWKFKDLNGIEAVAYNTTELSALKGKNVERYITLAGNNFTSDGKTSSGEFIDVTRFVDFLRSRMQENVFFRLVNTDKIPFDEPGFTVIESEVRAVLRLGIAVGGLSNNPAPTVTVPTLAETDANDRANRLLTPVKFTGRLAGAIHELEIRGVVTV